MEIDEEFKAHYARPDLEQKIFAALHASGKDTENLIFEDLAPVDEIHIGGRQATVDLAERLGLYETMVVLDVGCGLGGATRYFASTFGCDVYGIDLAPDYISAASALAARVDGGFRVSYQQASALALPFSDDFCDVVTMMHVGMNISDKQMLFNEVRRVLKPGGKFGIYDVMRVGRGDVLYPVPWASNPSTDFIAPLDEYLVCLKGSGFTVISEIDRWKFGVAYFEKLRNVTLEQGVSPLGLHISLGVTAMRQMVNISTLIKQRVLSPIEIICKLSK
ncbi:class I SAM-dependent methyltransferase [Pseudomonas carnis]|uniref:class I SAM-dependent methyltransferase n=1 Tax=Pseudomonas carnis TaxID=2487355 RepID=UPI001D47F88D|nr:class I SAM-dependent methyltransferase [Pseudomonas carnis]CAH0325047.1 2-methyl-6-phytyl-1,4-hydroquinone methyltransferase [Pseudomonas carnis]CAH0326062.1 2-methyl-6-phytyl-1,4-hydroquinone methyltransferase [Pseudomonas carnis]CAH0326070.1 2-methyl-6-phytyl-1,4-hydroquinone methyltransferase [Pseudomonas carnis]CAH0326092.1 2-methyl-6-phytyl-1,4-hydroquinone methyltransferase [Pseudomonas carnis]